jgi:hypothetical protein
VASKTLKIVCEQGTNLKHSFAVYASMKVGIKSNSSKKISIRTGNLKDATSRRDVLEDKHSKSERIRTDFLFRGNKFEACLKV